jgi:hypothetical protein
VTYSAVNQERDEEMRMDFTLQTRQTWIAQTYTTLQDAINAGLSLSDPESGKKCVPFDVSGACGEILWAWEMR